MPYEQFLAWANEDTLAEWVNGEVIMTSPASWRHQEIVFFLASVTRTFVEQHNLGAVLIAPFQMKLEQGREPDILFVAKSHLGRLKETYLDGPADVVVEIVSAESIDRDRGAKFLEYEAGGVPEYWLFDPLRKWVEFYHLGKEGRYTLAFSGQTGVYHSLMIPGFWLRIEWLWQKPLPEVTRISWEIIGTKGLRQILADLEQRETDQKIE
jgi:Uma2 family endonuclease